MLRPVVLPEPMEGLVRFVEETDPKLIVGATLARLRKGTAARDLLGAAAAAVSRSSELPADHHGGPVHPVAGISALMATMDLLEGDWKHMPVVHGVVLANRHIHAPDMGPTLMIEREPSRGDRARLTADLHREVEQLRPALAERHLLGLLDVGGNAGDVLEALLPIANLRNAYDDHYFLYPVYAMDGLDRIGWNWAPIVLRPVVRYLASNMRTGSDATGFTVAFMDGNFAFFRGFETDAPRLIAEHGLDTDRIALTAQHDESDAILALGEEIGEGNDYASIPERIARGLADGISVAGMGEVLSLVAGLRYVRTASFNPFDVHQHTGAYARRYLLAQPGVGRRNKVLALMNWAVGPEVRFQDAYLKWSTARGADPLPGADAARLLDEIQNVIMSWDRSDLSHPDESVACRESPTVQHVVALARQYAEAGFDADAFFRRMAELVCRDDYTEMHAFKQILATSTEYRRTRPSHRWIHLVSLAKSVATSWGLVQDVYGAAREERLAI